MSIADANIVLNTIIADSLSSLADELEKADDIDKAVDMLIKKTYVDPQKNSIQWKQLCARVG